MADRFARADRRNVPEARLDVLDGLRGIAILLVFVFHVWNGPIVPEIRVGAWALDLSPLFNTGFWGVELFFFLSGFCLFYPYARACFDGIPPPRLAHFVYRRAVKILPSYIVAILGAVLTGVAVFPSAADAIRQISLHLLFLHPWFSDSFFSISGVMWSLGVEVQFYVIFPVLAWCMSRRPALTMVGAVLLASIDRGVVIYYHAWNTNVLMAELPAKLDLFVSGMLAAYLFRFLAVRYGAGVRMGWMWTLLAVAGVAAYVGLARWVSPLNGQAYWPNFQQPYALVLLDGAFMAVTLGTLFGTTVWRRGLANPVFSFFGLISYNLYLWHVVIAVDLPRRGSLWFLPKADSSWDPHMQVLFSLIASSTYAIGAATVLTFALERPLLRIRR